MRRFSAEAIKNVRPEYHVGRADTIHSADQSYNSKCGNPNWGRPIQRTPYVAIAFEELVRKLGLNE